MPERKNKQTKSNGGRLCKRLLRAKLGRVVLSSSHMVAADCRVVWAGHPVAMSGGIKNFRWKRAVPTTSSHESGAYVPQCRPYSLPLPANGSSSYFLAGAMALSLAISRPPNAIVKLLSDSDFLKVKLKLNSIVIILEIEVT